MPSISGYPSSSCLPNDVFEALDGSDPPLRNLGLVQLALRESLLRSARVERRPQEEMAAEKERALVLLANLEMTGESRGRQALMVPRYSSRALRRAKVTML